MFNTTGANNNVSARGTGITSGFVDNFQDKLAQVQSANLFPQQPKPRFLDIYGPSLQTFFGALAAGKSDAPGPVGRATDIIGQALMASAPGMAQASALRRQIESQDPDEKLKQTALDLALDADAEKEKFTGKESFRARVPVFNEEGEKTGSVIRTLTRFVSDQGNLQFRDQNNQTITDFEPFYKKDTFEGPDGYQYQIEDDGSATMLEGQGAPDTNVKTFKGADGLQYMVRVNPNDANDVKAVLIPGQPEVEKDPFTFRGADGYTYILNASGNAEIIPGQGAPDKPIKTFKGTDGRTYLLDEDTRQAVLIPGQPEAEEDLEMFEGPNGIQYKVIDGEVVKTPGSTLLV